MNWSSELRNKLRELALNWATSESVPHYQSIGQSPTVLFEPTPDFQRHGNFQAIAWRAIVSNPSWRERLNKAHSQKRALPPEKRGPARELDSSNSSDALLMNCFCYPGAAKQVLQRLGLSTSFIGNPEFGIKARVPLTDGTEDATEIDMRIGTILFEAKLTEGSFTTKAMEGVRRYRDLNDHFDVSALPIHGESVSGYQLVRNVLAAAHHRSSLVVLLDNRRPDLMQEWWHVHSAISNLDLRLRCGFRTWQEVASACPPLLREFLNHKYGL